MQRHRRGPCEDEGGRDGNKKRQGFLETARLLGERHRMDLLSSLQKEPTLPYLDFGCLASRTESNSYCFGSLGLWLFTMAASDNQYSWMHGLLTVYLSHGHPGETVDQTNAPRSTSGNSTVYL